MSFIQQALSPFIGRKSKKKKEKPEVPQTYPYYPDPVIRYRRENSPYTATFPQPPLLDDTISCSTRSSSVKGWQTQNGFVPSRPISPTISNLSSCRSERLDDILQCGSSTALTPVPPPVPSPPPPTFTADFRESPLPPRSPTPPFPLMNSNSSTPCVTPAPSVAPLSRIPHRKTVSPSPERYISGSIKRKERNKSSSRPPPSPSPTTKSVGVQTPILGRRRIHLPGGATPVLGRRGLVGVVNDETCSRDSTYSQCSFQTCSDYKQRETTSLFRALSLTPKMKRKKKSSNSSNCDRCTNSVISGNSCSNISAFSFASTGSELQSRHNSLSNSIGGRSSRMGWTPAGSDISSIRGGRGSTLPSSSYCGDSISGSQDRGGNANNVVEVRVGEAGLVRRRRRNKATPPRRDGMTTSVRVSRHQETWHCLPLSKRGGPMNGDMEMHNIRASVIPEEVRLSATVRLLKQDHATLGIVIAGGSDRGLRPRVARLRPGSVAHRSDRLAPGDYILSVNGADTDQLSHAQLVALLRDAGNTVDIGIEYEAPSLPGIGPEGVLVRRTSVTVEREGGGLGVTVRGGRCPSHPDKSRPLVITHVRTAGPVDREGTIQAGDRLVAVDGRCVTNCTMTEAQDILRSTAATVALTIEYDVSVLTAVRQRGGALLVEVERPAATDLGLSFARGPQDSVVIEAIRTASIAERCGALSVGDTVTRLDGTCLSQLTAPEAMQLMRAARGPMLTLEIVPAPATGYGAAFHHLLPTSRNACSPLPASCTDTCSVPAAGGGHQYPPPSTSCTTATSCSAPPAADGQYPACPSYCTVGRQTARNEQDTKSSGLYGCSTDYRNRTTSDGQADPCTNSRTYAARTARSDMTVPPKRQDGPVTANGYVDRTDGNGYSDGRTEALTVALREAEGGGYGLVLRPPVASTDPDMAVPVLAAIDPYSPADRSGILCLGDRVTAVNGCATAGAGAAEVTQLIANSRTTVTLTVEFDLRENSTAAGGPGTPTAVTMAVKQQPLGLGITLAGGTASSSLETTCPGSFSPTSRGLHIASVTRGSPAHRSGGISAGDLLLAVDGVPVSTAGDPQETMRRVQGRPGETVTLAVVRDSSGEGCDGGAVQYTVEVARGGGPLGLTLSGSEDPLTVLRVAALTPGGLAERTGAIHAGDRLLAINGASLRDRPLSEAVRLLQATQDTVTLRIARPRQQQQGRLQQGEEERGMQLPAGLDVRQRIEEWAGSGVGAPSVDSAVESWGDSSGGGEPGSASPPTSPLPRSGGDSGLEGHPNSSEASESNDDHCNGQETNISNDSVNAAADSSNNNSSNGAENDLSTALFTQTTAVEGNKSSVSRPINSSSSSSTAPTVGGVRLPSTSPPPTPDSGQSEGGGAPRPDWDEMIAALNTISESCRITDVGASGAQRGMEVCSPVNGSTPLHKMGQAEEEGVYNVAAAELSHDTTSKTLPEEPGSEGSPQHIFSVALAKDPVYEDFGFSVSDGLYEKGVYVNRIRQGGPADRSGRVRPYDRILQVNDTLSHDFDCCLTVPLIAAAGDQLSLLLSRSLTVTPLLRRTPDIAVGPAPHLDTSISHADGGNFANGPQSVKSLGNGCNGLISPSPHANGSFVSQAPGNVVYGDLYETGVQGSKSPGSATNGNCYAPIGSQSMGMYGMTPMSQGYQCTRPSVSLHQSLGSFRSGTQSVMSHDSPSSCANPSHEILAQNFYHGSASTNRGESPVSGQEKINYQKAQFLNTQIYNNGNNTDKRGPSIPGGDHNLGSCIYSGKIPSGGTYPNQVLKSFGGNRPITSLPGYRPQNSYTDKSPSPSFENRTPVNVAAEVHAHPSSTTNRCQLLQWADQSLTIDNPTTATIRAHSQSPSLPLPKSPPTPPHVKSQFAIPPKAPLPPHSTKSPLTPQLPRAARRNVGHSSISSSSYPQQRSVAESTSCARDSKTSFTLQRNREICEISRPGDLSSLERQETLSNGGGGTTILRTL